MFRFFKKKTPRDIFNGRFIKKEAFKVGGIQYYQFNEIFNLPFERGIMALATYTELEMCVSSTYLSEHIKAMDRALNPPDGKISIYHINTLNEMLKERTNLIPDTEMLYKFASIVFFDENEQPYNYEYEYNQKKIAHWKKYPEALGFFLQQPIMTLIPFSNISHKTLLEALKVSDLVNQAHLERMQQLSSKE